MMQPLCQVWWLKREAEDIDYMSLFLLEIFGLGLNIREEENKDWKADIWDIVYTLILIVYIVNNSINPEEKRKSL